MEGESILPCKNILNHMLMRPSEDTKELEGTTWGVGSIEMFKILSHQFEFLERIKINNIVYVWKISRMKKNNDTNENNQTITNNEETHYIYCKDYSLDSGLIVSSHIFDKFCHENERYNDILMDCEVRLRGLAKIGAIVIDYYDMKLLNITNIEEVLTNLVREKFPIISVNIETELKHENKYYKLVIPKIFNQEEKEITEGFAVDTDISITLNYAGPKPETIMSKSTFLGGIINPPEKVKSEDTKKDDWLQGQVLGSASSEEPKKLTPSELREARLKYFENLQKKNQEQKVTDEKL
jgi:hypothetical protein